MMDVHGSTVEAGAEVCLFQCYGRSIKIVVPVSIDGASA